MLLVVVAGNLPDDGDQRISPGGDTKPLSSAIAFQSNPHAQDVSSCFTVTCKLSTYMEAFFQHLLPSYPVLHQINACINFLCAVGLLLPQVV